MKSEIQKVFEEFKEGKITRNDVLERMKQLKHPGKGNKNRIILTGKFTYNEPYLRNHVIFGKQVLLGMTHCSMAIEAARSFYPGFDHGHGDGLIHIHKFVFHQPVVVEPGDTAEVSITLERGDVEVGDKKRLFFRSLYKASSRAMEVTAASGEYILGGEFQAQLIDISSFRDHSEQFVSSGEIFERKLWQRPEVFQTVGDVFIRGGEVLGEMKLKPGTREITFPFMIHPVLLDGGFAVSVSQLADDLLNPGEGQGMWIPFMIKDIFIRGSFLLDDQCFCWGKVVEANPNVLTVDYCLCDDKGEVGAAVKGFTCKYAEGELFLKKENKETTESVVNVNQVNPGIPGLQEQDQSSLPGGLADELAREIRTYLVNKVAVLLGDSSGAVMDRQNKNFMDLGIDSNALIQLSEEIEKEVGIELYPTLFFEYQNLDELTRYFTGKHGDVFSRHLGIEKTKTQRINKSFYGGSRGAVFSKKAPLVAEGQEDIAIIGMAGRFAGSPILDVFWKNIQNGIDLTDEVPPDHFDWRPWFDKNRDAPNKTYCKWGSFIEVDKFDPMFFGISPREAVWMDPQFRILLEVVHEAIEDAGYGQRIWGSQTGVFVGICYRDYWDEIVRAHTPLVDYQASGCFLCSFPGRISYTFDLQGQSIPIDNACASSLTAVHLACKALHGNESDMAFAAGTNLVLSPLHYVNFARAQALSPTGRCRTFDKDADGYVPGEGAAAVLLKPLEKAIRDHDHIHAVIKGSAVNHVGKSNNPTSPRPELQTKVLLSAWKDAGISPDTISYIEAHGTGTILGDPIEINALKKAFHQFPYKTGTCAIGSVKTNVGHLEGAAGMAGLIKTVLSLEHKQIPVMPDFKELNPYINLEDSPLYINTQLQEWNTRSGVPRRAGISSFGMAGNNTHVVLEEYIPREKDVSPPVNVSTSTPAIFVLSARSEERLKVYAREMLDFLESKDISWADMIYSLQVGREAMEERLALVVSNIGELKKKLKQYCQGKTNPGESHGIENLYQGSIRGSKASYELLVEGEEGKEYVRRLMDNKKFNKLARVWVSGIDIDWNLLYPGNIPVPHRISLPTYPFKKERYWKPETPGVDGRAVVSPQVHGLHPLIDINESTLEEQCFKKVFTREDFCIRDHVVKGRMVLPGVAYLEMVRAAGELARKDRKVKKIKNMVWVRPIILERDSDSSVVYTGFYTDGRTDTQMNRDEEMVLYEVYTTRQKGKRLVHIRGQLDYGEPGEKQVGDERIDIKAIRKRCVDRSEGARYYELAEEAGLHYGESFRLMAEMYGNEAGSEALCFLELPRVIRPGFQEFGLHPSIMEGALQAVMGLNGSSRSTMNQVQPGEVYLPYSLGEVEILKPLTQKCVVYAVPAGDNTNSQVKNFNIQLADEHGHMLVKIKNFCMKAFKPQSYSETGAAAQPIEVMVFHDEWEEASLEPTGTSTTNKEDHVLVFFTGAVDDIQIGKTLEEQAAAVVGVKPGTRYQAPGQDNGLYEINPGKPGDYGQLLAALEKQGFIPTRIIHMWSQEKFTNKEVENNEKKSMENQLERGIYSLFYLTQALMRQGRARRVQLLYVYWARGGPQPQYAALSGFARTLYLENSKFYYKTVEIQRKNRLSSKELLAEFEAWKDEEKEVRYLDKGRFVRCLKEFNPESGHDQGKETSMPLHEKSVIVITGGAGSLGMIFARYLARQVKARLVLTDISELHGEMQKNIEELEKLGAEVLYIKVDISRQSEAEELISQAKSRFGQINGIIHCAGILRDAFIMNKTRAQVEAVLAPKVYGTVWLHEATKQEPLDFFVLFSSAAGVLGNPGQCDYAYANSFMDNFAEMRVKQGHPGKTLAIDWWLWKDGGMKSARQREEPGGKPTGIKPLETKTGWEMFVKGLTHTRTRFMVMEGNPARIRQLLNTGKEDAEPGREISKPTITRAMIDEDDLGEKIQEDLKKGVSRILNIDEKDIEMEADIREFGFDSVTFTEYSTMLNQWYNLEITPAVFFEHPNLLSLARYLQEEYRENLIKHYGNRLKLSRREPGEEKTGEPAPVRTRYLPRRKENGNKGEPVEISQPAAEPIAIIGMAGVMPQAENLEIFQEHLEAGKDLVTEIPPERWDWQEWYGDPGEPNKTNVKWGGFMNHVDRFDAEFFGISRREAELMDPQQRIFMETLWKTIEDAGYSAARLEGRKIGLFVGVAGIDYIELLKDRDVEVLPQMATGLSHSALANRLSFLLDWHGPSEPVDTACSSSLVALHLAVESIRSGDCEMAAAGGVNVIASPAGYITFSKSGMLCTDGRCKTFDKKADGYVRGEGCGAVLLKSLARARADRDHIYAVIMGTAVNHGGRTASLTAPSPNAQAHLLVAAWEKTGIDPATVGYIEAHGTGTEIGDPIEINGLKKAFEQLYRDWNKAIPNTPHCGIGSVKTNIGHLETAAGIAGVIKVLLSMKHKKLYPNLHFQELNPYIQLSGSPFYIVKENRAWERLKNKDNQEQPRRAGVSSFGFGGVNAHVVLEEWPGHQSTKHRAPEPGATQPYLLVLSAKNEERLKEYAARMIRFLEKQTPQAKTTGPRLHPADIVYTLQVGRQPMEERLAAVVTGIPAIQEKLGRYCRGDREIEDFYTGNIKKREAASLIQGEEGETFVRAIIQKGNPGKIARLWVSGVDIDWEQMYPGKIPRRISLPTYPFARKRYWVPTARVRQSKVKEVKEPGIEKPGQVPDDFFYLPFWEPARLSRSQMEQAKPGKEALTMTAANKKNVLLVYPLYLQGWNLEAAIAAAHEGDYIISLELTDKTGQQEIDETVGQLKQVAAVYFLGGIEINETPGDTLEQLEQGQHYGVLSLFRLIKSLNQYELTRDVLRLRVVTNDVYPVFPGDRVRPYSAGLHGLTRVIAREYPHMDIRSIDISLEDISTDLSNLKTGPPDLVKAFIAEPGSSEGLVTAFRKGRRYVRVIRPIRLPAAPGVPKPLHPLKHRGVYLILGGAGNVGMELSRHLAETVQARLVLVGRSQLQEDRQKKIARIKAAGGDVLYIQADAADLPAMTRAVRQARSVFGPIDGVIHAAGHVENKTLANMSEEMFTAVITPKIKGSGVLFQALKKENLDFLLFFSSYQSFLGEGGMSNYAAGNVFEDAFANYLNRQEDCPAISINWGYWGLEAVMTEDRFTKFRKHVASQGLLPFDPAIAVEAVRRILTSGFPQVMAIKAGTQFLENMEVKQYKPLELLPGTMDSKLETVIDREKQPVMEKRFFSLLEQLHDELHQAACCLLLGAFREMGVFLHRGEQYDKDHLKHQLGIIPGYYRLYDALLDILASAGFIRIKAQTVQTGRELENPDLQQQLKKLTQKKQQLSEAYPMMSSTIQLLWACLEKYPGILTGEIPAAEVIFPGPGMEMVEDIYKGNEVADFFNSLIVWGLLSYLEARIPMLKAGEIVKILEIGAGTGGTSAPLFEALAGYREKLHYVYTDISKSFAIYGKEHYGKENPYVDFNVLDIEKEVREQGYEPGSFDIVIAANVLHATRYIRDTLANTKVLLKRNGWLMIYEGTRFESFTTLTFGLLAGWWLYRDEQNRLSNTPLLGPGMWKRTLQEEGFPRVVMLGQPGENNKHGAGSQQVIIAESNGVVKSSRTITGTVPAPVSPGRPRENETPQHPPSLHPTGSQTKTQRPVSLHVEEKILDTLANTLQMDKKQLGLDTPYTEFGVDSILAIEITNLLNGALAIDLRSTDLFNYANIRKLTGYIVEKFGKNLEVDNKPVEPVEPVEPGENKNRYETAAESLAMVQVVQERVAPGKEEADDLLPEIAVIGMSGRFPDARDIHEFWKNLEAGQNSVKEASRWDTATFYDPDLERPDKSYCKWGAFLSGIDEFDPLFFNISPREAEMMDPQHRLFLEESWKAFEDAGYSDKELDGKKCGVFVGFNGGDYQRLLKEQGLPPDAYQMTGNFEAILSARISYFLNLRGPGITLNTACSSSLVAINLACESIRCGTSEIALAGGVMVTTLPEFYILLSRTDLLSPTGQCRVFDNRADGIVPGEGVGVVVLKPLDAALRDRDHIYGVIIGSGMNQDGRTNGITAPSASSQAELECEVYDRYHIHPENISYIEAHGTGTRLGDPIEIHALTDAFRKYTPKKQYCAVGSVKTNIGHSLAAAGIAGFIKVLMALTYKKIAPSLNMEQENEFINFKDSPFYVNTRLRDWDTNDGGPRIAAVSSFGFSGTNCHIVLKEAEDHGKMENTKNQKPWYLIPISARTRQALNRKLTDLAEWLEEKGKKENYRLKDISFTLLKGRSHFSLRSVFIVKNTVDIPKLVEILRETARGNKPGNYFTNVDADGVNGTPGTSGGESRDEPAMRQLGKKLIEDLQPTGNVLSQAEYKEKLSALADLYSKGYDLEWEELYRGEKCRRIALPTYPFAREKYWVVRETDREIIELMRKLEKGEITLPQANFFMEGRV